MSTADDVEGTEFAVVVKFVVEFVVELVVVGATEEAGGIIAAWIRVVFVVTAAALTWGISSTAFGGLIFTLNVSTCFALSGLPVVPRLDGLTDLLSEKGFSSSL